MIHLKRAYDKPAKRDGLRILVERLWPRGVSKEKAAIDLWLKEVSPSPELRTWFNHDPENGTSSGSGIGPSLKRRGNFSYSSNIGPRKVR